jgi:hypothetical protein
MALVNCFVALTDLIRRCGFIDQPVSRLHPSPLRLKVEDKSSTSKDPKIIFEGAHDGSNDAYWTLRICIKFAQERAEALALYRVRPLPDWHTSGCTSLELPFLLVAVDFEATVNGKVRQVGIATLDSNDLVVGGEVIAVDDWIEKIRVRSLVVDSFASVQDEHPMCRPDSGPLYASHHEVLAVGSVVDELRALLTPVRCPVSSNPTALASSK